MDLGELLLCAVTFDVDGVAKVLVALCDSRIDSKEAAEVDLAVGLDREAFEGDSAYRALRNISNRHAGIECCDQMVLRIGKTVRSAELAEVAEELGAAVDVETRALIGNPAEAIAAFTKKERVDLAILTLRRGKGVLGSRPGSMTYELLTVVATPVLAIPGTPPDG